MTKNSKILLHACCAICSGHPIEFLKEMGYEPVVYFCNPNIYPQEEFFKRLEAQKLLCETLDCELIVEDYSPQVFIDAAAGFEKEPEKGKRCTKCFEIRLEQTAKKAKELGLESFTTSIVISPHKNFELISALGKKISEEYNINYQAINFKKHDGLLKTNQIANKLNLYRQKYCGCRYSIR